MPYTEPKPADIESDLAAAYGTPIDASSFRLIRHGFNHTYAVESGGVPFAFRVYLRRKYYVESTNDLRFELKWLRFLRAEGLPVAAPVARADGELLGSTSLFGEEDDHCALFKWATGERHKELSVDEARRLGETMARLHAASDRFHSPHRRYHLDLTYLLHEPLRLIEAYLRSHDRPSNTGAAPRAREYGAIIERIRKEPAAYGLIHGDCHNGNMYFDDAGSLTLFDFDHSGYGWRAYDLATADYGLSEEVRAALFDGYEAVRPLSAEEKAAIPAFQKLRPLWDIGDVLATPEMWNQGDEPFEKYVEYVEKVLAGL
jgi:Ser/Thr protein kinase RdoA (MazF antagonist)